jgi:uncharacterized protein YkwD
MRNLVVSIAFAWFAALPAVAAPRDMSAQVLDLVNAERAKHGCPPLQINARLVRAAERQSREMATQDFFSHNDPDGTTPGQRVHDTGYVFQMIGENIEAGTDTAEDAVDGWMHSPGHRANILTCAYRETGIAVYGLDDGQSLNGRATPYRYYWTQVFALPFR